MQDLDPVAMGWSQLGAKGLYWGDRMMTIRPPQNLLDQGSIQAACVDAIVINCHGLTRAQAARRCQFVMYKKLRTMPPMFGKWGQSMRVRATPAHLLSPAKIDHKTQRFLPSRPLAASETQGRVWGVCRRDGTGGGLRGDERP